MITIICKKCGKRHNMLDIPLEKGREYKCECGHILLKEYKLI
jgi:lysyl-tRNA synthetase class I